MKVGDLYPVWWATNRQGTNGWNLARILDINPYTGLYKDFYTHDLTLETLTRKGSLIMSVNLK